MMRLKGLLALAAFALVLAACGNSGGSDETVTVATGGDSGATAAGQQLYQETCSACHGTSAEGVDGLGTALVTNSFIQSMTDPELVEFITVGRPTSDPDNTTGIAMPAKGGNSALTDEWITDIAKYLRTLQ